MINYVILGIDKDEFLKSKFNDRQYKSFGNFAKHIKEYGYDLDTYTLRYYKDKIPKCIESGEISDYKIKGYWNRWWPITQRHKKLLGLTRCYYNKLNTIASKNLMTEYLQIDYWKTKSKYSEKLKVLNWLIDKKWYIRLHDSFYDETWTMEGKDIYKNSILNENPIRLKPVDTLEGLMQRGNNFEEAYKLLKSITSKRKPNKRTFAGMLLEGYTADEIPTLLKEYYKNKPCIFRNKEIQKQNSAKKLAKYSKSELRCFTVRCNEYWMRKGYSLDEAVLKVSEAQQLNTIQSIMKRLNCTEYEAMDVQRDIYDKRAYTMSQKSDDELANINSRKDSGSYEYCLRKCQYNEHNANILYGELIRKRIVPFGRASKESLQYFLPLYKSLRLNGITREDIYFGINGSKEYGVYDIENRKYRFYDFTILSKRLMIEYDGMYWHSNEDAQLNDEYKTNLAHSNGFKLLRINSNDTKQINKTKIEEFINKEISIDIADW